ncbi:beta-glucosidase [Clostridium cavendishii DSM 21758]|uniref:beta-N-acetylhexosaminidase n=1 Tax=Clostridium cavendishii DSM 21758 TaxID=1121302 RepID=A0A1M6F643_9CLOT|nr:glycoside hydrolase family 3 N-terminal domain-containing protein [Clostridium cavendishii]SHI93150.1 beta-glucosidase [Clostridium cavendishii DSM 21758]
MRKIKGLLILVLVVSFIASALILNDKITKSLIGNNETKEILNKLTLEEKLEQMIIIELPYVYENNNKVDFTKVTDSVKEFLKTRKPGGIILFKNNMISEEQSQTMIKDIKSCKDKIPFFITVDEEGGRISQVPVKLNIKTAADIGRTGNPKNAFEAAKTIGSELKKLGFNVDYAPVMDVNTNPKNPIIGDRSFSPDPKIVATFGTEYINGLKEQGILSTAKHFPGHGDTIGDSHKGFVEVTHDINRIESVELLPFREAIKANVDFIMVGHITVPALDSSKTPSSLSKPIVTNLLKEKMGFKGVVITDALNMGAVTQNYNKLEAVKLAINSGCDIALMPDITVIPGKDISSYDELIKYLVDEVRKGNIKEERIDDAVLRILDKKQGI